MEAGADPASKFRGGDFHNIWLSSLIRGFTTVREMNYASQHCCVKTMEGKISLNCECFFRNCTKSWWI